MPKITKNPTMPAAPTTALPGVSINKRVVTIDVPINITHDKAKMDQVTSKVLHHLGCGPCHSGWDLRFRHIRDMVINPGTLATTSQGIVER